MYGLHLLGPAGLTTLKALGSPNRGTGANCWYIAAKLRKLGREGVAAEGCGNDGWR